MKHFTYIDHNVNNHINDEEMSSFITQLINNQGLRKEYQRYIKLENFLNEQEERLGNIIKELPDFIFDVNQSFNAVVKPDDNFTVQDRETSKLIRSVIESNRPPDTHEKKGWFRAASVLSILMLVLSWDTAAIVLKTNRINMLNVILTNDYVALNEPNYLR